MNFHFGSAAAAAFACASVDTHIPAERGGRDLGYTHELKYVCIVCTLVEIHSQLAQVCLSRAEWHRFSSENCKLSWRFRIFRSVFKLQLNLKQLSIDKI